MTEQADGGPRSRWTRAQVLRAAIDLADLGGIESLSMRKLSQELGGATMSLYNHVSNKADILDGLAERAFDQVELPDPALPWPQRLRAVALSMYEVFGRTPVVCR